jgi:hypothetical protein
MASPYRGSVDLTYSPARSTSASGRRSTSASTTTRRRRASSRAFARSREPSGCPAWRAAEAAEGCTGRLDVRHSSAAGCLPCVSSANPTAPTSLPGGGKSAWCARTGTAAVRPTRHSSRCRWRLPVLPRCSSARRWLDCCVRRCDSKGTGSGFHRSRLLYKRTLVNRSTRSRATLGSPRRLATAGRLTSGSGEARMGAGVFAQIGGAPARAAQAASLPRLGGPSCTPDER